MKNRKFRRVRAFMGGLLLLTIISCAGRVTIEMDEKVPPTFAFKRNSDHVYFIPIFSVSEVDPENLNIPLSKPERENKIIWQIEPPTGPAREIENLPPITYGVVPRGFSQIIPATGTPPPLENGKTYEAGGPAVMVPKGFLRFTIRDGKAIRVSVRSTHLSRRQVFALRAPSKCNRKSAMPYDS